LSGRTSKKRGFEKSHEKRIYGFHSTWVEIQTLAAWDVVETVAVAKEAAAKVPVRLCQGR
jgi:hypothetical protein